MPAPPLIDVNATLGRWPMRRVPLDDTAKLVAKLRSHNVVEAWAGSYDGLFHHDLTGVNDRLAAECRSHSHSTLRLVPFGEINPLLPNWENELRRCAEHHRMPGIRLHPNYHGYKLDHLEFAKLLVAASEHGLLVQLVVQMEDERMMHPLLRVPPVDLKPLAELLSQTPGLRLVLLNALRSPRPADLERIVKLDQVSFDIAMLETAAGIEQLIPDVAPDRILFGSHAPSFYFESAVLKLQESTLPLPVREAIGSGNARELLPA